MTSAPRRRPLLASSPYQVRVGRRRVDSTGRVIEAAATAQGLVVVRRLLGGAVDHGFAGGVATLFADTSFVNLSGLELDASGRIVLAGTIGDVSQRNTGFVARLDATVPSTGPSARPAPGSSRRRA